MSSCLLPCITLRCAFNSCPLGLCIISPGCGRVMISVGATSTHRPETGKTQECKSRRGSTPLHSTAARSEPASFLGWTKGVFYAIHALSSSVSIPRHAQEDIHAVHITRDIPPLLEKWYEKQGTMECPRLDIDPRSSIQSDLERNNQYR